MNQIEHEPREKRPTWTIWWLAWGIVIGLWAITIFGDRTVDWENAMLGIGTGALLATWAIEITGNKVPSSWRRNRRH